MTTFVCYARYAVIDRYSCSREFNSKAKAIQCAKDERADGWPVKVRDMTTDTIVWPETKR